MQKLQIFAQHSSASGLRLKSARTGKNDFRDCIVSVKLFSEKILVFGGIFYAFEPCLDFFDEWS